ncbi:MAG: SRPBCC domain-containing protein [Paludibaculum sp.]
MSGQRLWRAWADPQLLQQWFCDHAWGNIRLGGDYFWKFSEFDVQAHSRIIELMPGGCMTLNPRARRWSIR